MLILKVKCLLSKTNSEQNQSVGCDKTKTQPTQIVLFSILVLRVKSIQFRWESKGGSRYQNEFQLSLLAHWWEARGCIRMPGLSSLSGRMTLWIICTVIINTTKGVHDEGCGLAQWVASSSRKLPSLLSNGWFQKWIWAWFHNQTKNNRRPYSMEDWLKHVK